jgi:hypothetical protein
MTDPTYSVRVDLDPSVPGVEEYFYNPKTDQLFMATLDPATRELTQQPTHIQKRSKSAYGETQFRIGTDDDYRIIGLSVEGDKAKLDFFDLKGQAFVCEDKATFKGYVHLNAGWTNFEHAITPSEVHKKPATVIAVAVANPDGA